jgi:spermidine synthase
MLPLPSVAVESMPENARPPRHVKPFVQEGGSFKSLHFSIREVQSRMSLDDPCALDLEYSRTMMGFLLFKPEPKHIAMVGLGGGSLAKFCHCYLPATRTEVVEINPHVLALRDEFQIPPDDERLCLRLGDGADFVRDTDKGCDVLMVDGFDYDGQPSVLSSQAFYDDCADLLPRDGILVVNLFNQHAEYALLVDRIRRSFADAVLVVEGPDLGNSIVLAFKEPSVPVQRKGVQRPPRHLEGRAARQLAASFALTLTALKQAQQ